MTKAPASAPPRGTEGMEAVEGLLVLTAMTLMLVFFMSFGFLFYQQSVVATAANDAATRIAQSYAYGGADPVMGFISRSMRVSLSPYRYWLSLDMTPSLQERREDMAEKYAKWYLSRASFALEQGTPEIIARTVHDGLAQRHIEVDITVSYELPVGWILQLIGIDKVVEYHATGRAVCLDLSDYIYTVNTANAFTNYTAGSKLLGAFNSVAGLAQKIRNTVAKVRLAMNEERESDVGSGFSGGGDGGGGGSGGGRGF